ncbi:MAG TPA: response regulator transcription factor [Gemmatimonadaceae bacterium]|nr:response regulator transcription factor [Gemmatimonadaceae bacterium]
MKEHPQEAPEMDHQVTCVVVDDHEAIRAGTRARLEGVDWISVIGEACTAEEAMREIRKSRPDLVLMDVRMPGGNGTEAAATLVAEGIDSRVVIYSGYVTTALAEQALEAGAFGVVLKGSPLSTVVDALRSTFEGRRYLDPTIAADMVSSDRRRGLSARELEILQCMANGGQNATIAFELGISVETVKAHVSNVFKKVAAGSRTEAVALGLREGLIE